MYDLQQSHGHYVLYRLPTFTRMVFIRVRYAGKIDTIPEISKMATIRQLVKEITELTDLSAKEQRLFFRGKELGMLAPLK